MFLSRIKYQLTKNAYNIDKSLLTDEMITDETAH